MVDPLPFKAVQFIQPVNYFSVIAVITVLLMCLLLSQNCATVEHSGNRKPHVYLGDNIEHYVN